MSFTKLLGTALVAGLLSAFVTAGFHWFFTEPLIDRAVAIEDQASSHAEEPVVTRPMQKFGLFVGLGVYGVAWGILFGVLVYAIGPKLKVSHSLVLALILGWSVGLFPLLKYPANPPGVGEAATIGYRQELFVLLIALSLIGTVAAFIAENSLRRAGRPMPLLIIAAYVAYMVCLYSFLPANPDPVKIDTELVRHFRIVSCAGQIVFWTVLGGAFGMLAGYRSSATSHV